MIELSNDSLLRRTPSILETEVDGDTVLMSIDLGHCYGLDAIGSKLWQSLQVPTSLAQLQELCCRLYEGDPVAIRTDVSTLVSQLVQERLLEVVR